MSSESGLDPQAPYAFPLDAFQLEACASLNAGRSVLVAAPTSSGKTVAAEHAVRLALAGGTRCFYTTPIKALSNQKFRDLRALHGADAVGLLTGDNSINGAAPIVVMTTEVLRNMIYARSRDLATVSHVVLDEVHYLEDPARGPVWEEIIIHLPLEASIVALSATVSNAEDLAAWIRQTRGPTDVVIETARPVALEHQYMIGERGNRRPRMIPTLRRGKPNREGHRYDVAGGSHAGGGRHGKRQRRPWVTPRRTEVVEALRHAELLPAIVFVFSRAGCDDAADACFDRGMVFTDDTERARVRAVVDERLGHLSATDHDVLGIERWTERLEAGIASHHAGLIPACKEVVETLFIEGVLRVVFATETLALGVNMPARSVVIERLTKFTGEHHELLTPGQYTQLTGRAGRRGLDTTGTAIVLWSPFLTFSQVAELAGSTSYVLRSAFRPTYNMVANLTATHDRDHALELVSRSFAQFQTTMAVERLRTKRSKAQRKRDDLVSSLTTPLEELRMRRRDADDERPRGEVIDEHVALLRPGQLILLDDEAVNAVLSVSFRKNGRINVKVIDEHGDAATVPASSFEFPPMPIGEIELPIPFLPNDEDFQASVASSIAAATLATSPGSGGAGDRVRQRQIDGRKLDQIDELDERIHGLERRIVQRDESLATQLVGVHAVLEARACANGWALTSKGEMLTRVFHECDLLVVEALTAGVFDDLDDHEFAGIVSTLTYEHRRSTPPPAPWFSSGVAEDAYAQLRSLARKLNAEEKRHRLPLTREPDATLFGQVHAWSAGVGLGEVLDDDELSGGDFVRNIRLVIDLLDQIQRVTADPRAGSGAERLRRGIVLAADGLDDEGDDDPASDRESSPDEEDSGGG